MLQHALDMRDERGVAMYRPDDERNVVRLPAVAPITTNNKGADSMQAETHEKLGVAVTNFVPAAEVASWHNFTRLGYLRRWPPVIIENALLHPRKTHPRT
jgi:hypothetical protein